MIAVTFTLPEALLWKIDKDRGRIKRSAFIVKLLKKAYES